MPKEWAPSSDDGEDVVGIEVVRGQPFADRIVVYKIDAARWCPDTRCVLVDMGDPQGRTRTYAWPIPAARELIDALQSGIAAAPDSEE